MLDSQERQSEGKLLELCGSFGKVFSTSEINYAFGAAQEIGPAYVGKLFSGVKAVQVAEPKYFQRPDVRTAVEFYGDNKGILLLALAEYQVGEPLSASMGRTLEAIRMVTPKDEVGVRSLVRQRIGCVIASAENVIFDNSVALA